MRWEINLSRNYLAFSNRNNWKHVLIRIKELSVEDVFPADLYRIIRQDSLQFYLLFIYQQAIWARRNLQFNSCASQSLKSWGLGLLHALRHRVLGCSIDYCSHVKATSYSIVIKTKHWQTKFVSSHQRIICWAFKEEKGVGERRINCSIIPKYNENQQKSYIHWVSL